MWHILSDDLPIRLSLFAQRSILERAVEEQPTEIFVKQEIPFDLGLVGTLLDEIRNSLIGGNSSTHQSFLPELRVTKMDDITSCLTVLRDYVASISCDVAKTGNMFQLELKRSRDQITDLELQLQETILESESSEGGLLAQLQVNYCTTSDILEVHLSTSCTSHYSTLPPPPPQKKKKNKKE